MTTFGKPLNLNRAGIVGAPNLNPIHVDRATIKPQAKSAKPDFQLDKAKNRIFGHLTDGWSGSNWTGDAVTWTASVPVDMTLNDVSLWEFGFVQFAEATSFEAFYSGRYNHEGSIGTYYFVPPALTQKIILDGADKDQPEPWYRAPGGNLLGKTFTISSGDHPGLAVPLVLKNKGLNYVDNYLFHVYMDRRFWTIFTAKSPKGGLTYISHFSWRLRYDFKVMWKNAEPVKSFNASILTVPTSGVSGKPTDPEIQTLLDNPVGPRANDLGTKAQSIAESAGGPPCRIERKTRYVTTPENFWS